MTDDMATGWRAAAAKAASDMGIVHKDGIPWHEAPIPPRRHTCVVSTEGWSGLTKVERCACGAMRLDVFGPWTKVNERRQGEKVPWWKLWGSR